ncbi:MAG: UbiA family prenyltransferase [Spirosomataceae bacterium]
MTPKEIFIHLRLPFSLLLLPVFLFAISVLPGGWTNEAWGLFFIWHFLVYPASNAFNSYFDKDESPIGGLKTPPKVDRKLYLVATGMDIFSLLLSLLLYDLTASCLILGYILLSRAYSAYPIRLKRFPFLSWLIVGFFQGAYVFLVTIFTLELIDYKQLIQVFAFPALLSSGILWAIYPITQVYQHKEDSERGDQTLSILLGIRGTFLFTAFFFGLSTLGYFIYFDQVTFLLWFLFLTPTTAFFLYWFWLVWKDTSKANFTNTMRLNVLAALFLNLFYLLVLLK